MKFWEYIAKKVETAQKVEKKDVYKRQAQGLKRFRALIGKLRGRDELLEMELLLSLIHI